MALITRSDSKVQQHVKHLLRIPAWSQLTDQMGSFGRDTNAAMDCGEECLSILVYGTRGIAVPAGYIRWLMGVAEGNGTTGEQLASYLRSQFYNNAVVRWPNASSAWNALRNQARLGKFSIMLGDWDTLGVGHWGIPQRFGDNLMDWHDPWTGLIATMSRETFDARYMGQLVQVEEPASYP